MIRRWHGRGSFVGTSSRDAVGFVGTEQASTSGPVRSAIENTRARMSANMNQPLLPRRKDEMYRPQLSVGFDVGPPGAQAISSAGARQLKVTHALQSASRFEVSVEGRTATLRGEVASERDRALAQQILLFEPGIDEVRNLLTLKAPPAVPSARPESAAQRPK